MDQTHYRDGNVVLYKRPNVDVWQARLKLPSGSWKRISTKQRNIDDAAAVACDAYDEMRFRVRNNLVPDSRKFRHVCEQYIKEIDEQIEAGIGKTTYAGYKMIAREYILPFMGEKEIASVDTKLMVSWDQWRNTKMGRRPKKTTVLAHNACMNGILNCAVAHGWLSPAQVPKLVTKGEPTVRHPMFSQEQVSRLIGRGRFGYGDGRTEKGKELRWLLGKYVEILANTGMRPGGEPLSLRWKDLEEWKNPKDGKHYLRIWIPDSKTVPHECITELSLMKVFKQIKKRSKFKSDDDLVFRTSWGAIPDIFPKTFAKVLKGMKMTHSNRGEKFTLYSLRHYYITKKLVEGVPIQVIATNCGTSFEMIQDHYNHMKATMNADQLASQKGAAEYLDPTILQAMVDKLYASFTKLEKPGIYGVDIPRDPRNPGFATLARRPRRDRKQPDSKA